MPPTSSGCARSRDALKGLRAAPLRTPKCDRRRPPKRSGSSNVAAAIARAAAPDRGDRREFGRGAKGRSACARSSSAGLSPRLLARAARVINYRRFFDINELVALRVEDAEVFAAVHALVLDWSRDGEVDGLRVDHIDGLLDPRAYLERLRGEASARSGRRGDRFPIFVEKILTAGEPLRDGLAGAGHDGLRVPQRPRVGCSSIPAARRRSTALYRSLRPGRVASRSTTSRRSRCADKLRILTRLARADVRGLAAMLVPIAKRDRARPDVRRGAAARRRSPSGIACFPVYRTYIDARTPAPSPRDRAVVERVARAPASADGSRRTVIDFLRDVLLDAGRAGGSRASGCASSPRLQQTERAGDGEGRRGHRALPVRPASSRSTRSAATRRDRSTTPSRASTSANADRAARLAAQPALHEHPRHQAQRRRPRAARRARRDSRTRGARRSRAGARLNAPHRARGEDAMAPDANSEYLLYQTLLGIWPLDRGEAQRACLTVRAIGELRERVEDTCSRPCGRRRSTRSWTDPNEEYEDALEGVHRRHPAIVRRGEVAVPARRRRRRVARRAERRLELALADRAAPDRARRAGPLSRRRAVELHPRRSGQPPAGRLRARGARSSPRSASGTTRRRHRGRRCSPSRRRSGGRPHEAARDLARCCRRAARTAELFTQGQLRAARRRRDRARHVVAFARRLGTDALDHDRVAADVALSGIDRPPVGADVWGDTHVVIPTGLGARWRCTIAGEEVRGEQRSDGVVLELSPR